MPAKPASSVLDELRDRIERLEGGPKRDRQVLPFGVPEIDERLPGGGLALGALHEVAGGGNGAVDGAAAALFAPALAQAGLSPGRVIYVEAGDEATLLSCFEDGLRHGGLGAVVAEVAKLTMTASRRLQLAAEGSGTIAIAVRRWRRQSEAADFGQPTASVTRWRVSVLPSVALPVAGIGRARWLLELIRCRAGECADFEVEASDGKGRIALSAEMAHRSAAPQIAWKRAAR